MSEAGNLLEMVPEPLVESRQDGDDVVVLVPRARAAWLRWLLARLNRSARIQVRLDRFGSSVWGLVDGRRTVAAVGEELRREFGAEVEPLYPRLGQFLQALERAGALRLAASDGVGR